MINLNDENVRNLIKALAREELKKMIATEKAELMQNVQKEVAVSIEQRSTYRFSDKY